jgi:hypothetical protein
LSPGPSVRHNFGRSFTSAPCSSNNSKISIWLLETAAWIAPLPRMAAPCRINRRAISRCPFEQALEEGAV